MVDREATVTIGGAPQAFTQRYAYDAYDRLQATIYPDGEAIKEYPNSRGLPRLLCPAALQASGDYWCTSSPKLVDSAAYNANGQLLSVNYPAGGSIQRIQAQLGKANNGRQWVVEFVRHPSSHLTNGGQLGGLHQPRFSFALGGNARLQLLLGLFQFQDGLSQLVRLLIGI